MSLVTPITTRPKPGFKDGRLPPRNRSGTAQILILPCIRREPLTALELDAAEMTNA